MSIVLTSCAYLNEVKANLPRLLALVDRDCTSETYGLGDRYHWAWGLIDFSNATFQGMANGLARLWCNGLWPYETSSAAFIKRIDSLYFGARKITRSDGSLEEAFPNEGSFCVTALVAFDLLVAYEQLKDQIDVVTQERWIETVRPMIDYLIKADETHALISNHLATAVAALVRWSILVSDAESELRAQNLLNRVLEHQSVEGWFVEYQGADPGYQSLCTSYLADVHKLKPQWCLLEPLRRSIQFLWHFAHPDGSFGGLYGSRNTRFYYPAGILLLADEVPEATVLAKFMERSIATQSVVSLSSIDEPNLVPSFNAYCWAATLASGSRAGQSYETLPELPALRSSPFSVHFEEAGLLLDRGREHYTVIALSKGGTVYHFERQRCSLIDCGVVVRNTKGLLGSSQTVGKLTLYEAQRKVVLVSQIARMPKRSPRPWQFVVLRLLCISVFRFPAIREWIKQKLVRMLITGENFWPVENERTIYLGQSLKVYDKTQLTNGYELLKGVKHFVPIHMASQGYWQRQDEGKL